MFQTGLLILTSSPRILTSNVSAYLKAAKNLVNKTLYIKLEPNRHHLWPVQQPVFTPSELSQLRKLIPDIYFKAAGVCAHLDIRVLQSCFKDAARNESHLKAPFDVVLTDSSHARADLELYLGHQFNKSCSNFHYLDSKLTVNDSNEDNLNGFNHASNGVQNISTFQTFESVCLGGTFDRLHLGHKVLLSEAVLHASGKLVVGVTDGDMLKGKLLWELIEPVEMRIRALIEFLQDIDSTLQYDVIPIYNPYGPTIEDSDLECLYVSEETMKGGRLVNEERARRSMPPMVIRSVGLAEDVCRSSGEEFKVSSSSLRRRQLGTILNPPKPRPGIPDQPYLIGLTGGICTGKSHIIQKLESLGAVVINCDPLGHESYRPGTQAYAHIVETFGDQVVSPDGTINRKVLGAIIFADEAKRQQLNKIVWPEVSRLIDERLEEHRRKGTKLVIMESALLLEAGWEEKFHQIWLCIIPVEEALKRVMARDNLEKDQALRRIQAQMSNKERVDKANVIFCSLWDYATTERQVEKAWNELQVFLAKNKPSAL
ncbi:bifunctional Phosphopantetheine adenylyltransferase - Dephospho-CoA kinase [Amblyomma americanum]